MFGVTIRFQRFELYLYSDLCQGLPPAVKRHLIILPKVAGWSSDNIASMCAIRLETSRLDISWIWQLCAHLNPKISFYFPLRLKFSWSTIIFLFLFSLSVKHQTNNKSTRLDLYFGHYSLLFLRYTQVKPQSFLSSIQMFNTTPDISVWFSIGDREWSMIEPRLFLFLPLKLIRKEVIWPNTSLFY